jgi:transposase
MPASRDTILRTLCRADSVARPTPRVLGVDDFAFRRGQSYGTILVDLEAHRPIDLLSDRTAVTLAEWLTSHPGIEVIARDRSREYARGATEGAPEAQQVADRFHLLVNLREALERLLARLQGGLRSLPLDEQAAKALAARTQAISRPLRGPSPSEQPARQARRASRLARWEAVRALYVQGTPIRQIAKTLGLSWTTARNFAVAEVYPERGPKSPQPSLIDSYVEYLASRWDAGCHNASQLWRELIERGHSGTRIQVARWAHQRRETRAVPDEPRDEPHSAEAGADDERIVGSTPRATLVRLPGSRELAWLLIRVEEKLDDEELTLRHHILQDSDIATARDLAQRFGRMVRNRRADQLADWIRACQVSGLTELRNFATYIAQDRAAVEAGLTERWSNGQTEGQITRLKLIKRQMYGQAGFVLLRRRVLQPA